jgi:tellurite resistance protein
MDHAPMSRLAVLKTLACVAWADERIASREQALLEGFAERWGLTEPELDELREFGRHHRTLDEAPLDELEDDEKQSVVEQAVMLALIDGDDDPKERAVIVDLVTRLGVDATALVKSAVERMRRIARE